MLMFLFERLSNQYGLHKLLVQFSDQNCTDKIRGDNLRKNVQELWTTKFESCHRDSPKYSIGDMCRYGKARIPAQGAVSTAELHLRPESSGCCKTGDWGSCHYKMRPWSGKCGNVYVLFKTCMFCVKCGNVVCFDGKVHIKVYPLVPPIPVLLIFFQTSCVHWPYPSTIGMGVRGGPGNLQSIDRKRC